MHKLATGSSTSPVHAHYQLFAQPNSGRKLRARRCSMPESHVRSISRRDKLSGPINRLKRRSITLTQLGLTLMAPCKCASAVDAHCSNTNQVSTAKGAQNGEPKFNVKFTSTILVSLTIRFQESTIDSTSARCSSR